MQRVDPFPASDFDAWADTYDEDVARQDLFPFIGYSRVLDAVLETAAPSRGMSVLDIGVGTGNLARRFVDAGCEVWGLDFSSAMLEKARRKLRGVKLMQHDLRAAWPAALERRFDRIVSAYTLHHFELQEKLDILDGVVRKRLQPGGRIVIADISFATLDAMREFAAANAEAWEEEPYWLADQALEAMRAAGWTCAYEQASACGGVYRFEPS